MDYQAQLGNQLWRLNNLYWIQTKQAKKIQFKMNWAQLLLFHGMWYLNCILKARQLGMTTFIQIFMLDRALFNDNQNCGVVAHNKDDAEAFFTDKIKFAYDNLPEDLKAMRPFTSNSARHIKFNNGSQIRVGTSLRSGTYQYVHVSEFGKMCAKYPEKAQEVITGTLNTVAAGQFIFIESTAEGPFGEFYDMCVRSEDFTASVEQYEDLQFTAMDYKFFFFPWWQHPDYVLSEKVEIPPKLSKYFQDLREEQEITLTPDQQSWYVKKAEEQGEMMKQEYPATPAESFERTREAMILGEALRNARRDKRICKLPVVRGVPINTFWDLGRNDNNSIWFHQHINEWHHFIYYLEGRLQDLTYYAGLLAELKVENGWIYGKHYLPHDGEVTDLSAVNNESRERILNGAGVTPTVIVPRIPNLIDGIELTRKVFPQCKFDEEGCEVGLRALSNYEWKYDEVHKMFRTTPADTWGKNGADALRTFAQGYRGNATSFREQAERAAVGGNERKYMRRRGGSVGTVFNPTTDHVV